MFFCWAPKGARKAVRRASLAATDGTGLPTERPRAPESGHPRQRCSRGARDAWGFAHVHKSSPAAPPTNNPSSSGCHVPREVSRLPRMACAAVLLSDN